MTEKESHSKDADLKVGRRKRALVLEDVDRARRALCRALDLHGIEAHGASSLEEAYDLIARIAFHVACLDLTLDELAPSNFEGQEVLRQIAELGEGTRTIIVSQRRGDRAFDISIDAFTKYGLTTFLRKGQFSTAEFVTTVREQANSAELAQFESLEGVLDVLLYGEDEAIWVDQALRLLEPKGGYATLRRVIEALFSELRPLRPKRDESLRAVVDDEGMRAVFEVWSRAAGLGVTGIISREELPESTERVFRRASFGGLHGAVVEAAGAQLGDYLPA